MMHQHYPTLNKASQPTWPLNHRVQSQASASVVEHKPTVTLADEKMMARIKMIRRPYENQPLDLQKCCVVNEPDNVKLEL